MRSQIVLPEKVELYVRELDDHISVENRASGVIIRATQNHVSASRKAVLIRYLAAEGYIPDRYEWFCEPADDGFFGVKWIDGVCRGKRKISIRTLQKCCNRRNIRYGCLFILWLLSFWWAVRHTVHGL